MLESLLKKCESPKEFVESTRVLYPHMCLTGSKDSATQDEINLFKKYLNHAVLAGDVDPELVEYLERINATNKIVTVFSCWGHPLPDYQEGNLLFRSNIGYDKLFNNFIFPLVEEYHHSNYSFRASMHVWSSAGKEFRGYCLSGFPVTETKKHAMFNRMCQLLESI